VSPVLALRVALVRAGFAAGGRMPVRRRVVLATSHADHLGGNLAWIRDALARSRPDAPVTVLAWRPWGRPLARAAAALRELRAGFLLATSSLVVVDDYFFPMYAIRPRPGTRFVQVWHACGAFKKFGYSVADKGFGADETRLDALPIHTNYDLCLVSSRRFVAAYAEAFRQAPQRFTSALGIPRTDLFFDEGRKEAAAAEVRRRYGLPEGRRVILYAPTFRGERTTRARTPDALDLPLLARELGGDHVLLLRAHPFVAAATGLDASLGGFVREVSDHPDINELMLVSDVLVTDYSSAMYEFALLGRPIGFFAPDHAAYEAERGFYFDFAAGVPGPVFETSEALTAWLRDGPFDTDRVRQFAADSFDVADGGATRRFVSEVVDPALGR
jgi:teichoic acid ribitol-phosphate primase